MTKRTCSEPECDRPMQARNLCKRHWTNWYRARNRKPAPTTSERFWAKVNKNGPTSEWRPDLGPCWLWTASLTGEQAPADGTRYGQFHVSGQKKMVRAHVWSYVDTNGPVPDGMSLDHMCHVRNCVRPDHLEIVTQSENTRRGWDFRGRDQSESCKRGHPWVEENILWNTKGKRECRSCRRQRQAHLYRQAVESPT